MKSIKLKNPKSIHGIDRKAGDVIKVGNPKDDIDTIGELCANDLIRRGDAEEVTTKAKASD